MERGDFQNCDGRHPCRNRCVLIIRNDSGWVHLAGDTGRSWVGDAFPCSHRLHHGFGKQFERAADLFVGQIAKASYQQECIDADRLQVVDLLCHLFR